MYCNRDGYRKTSLVITLGFSGLTMNNNRPEVKSFPELVVAIMTDKCPPIPEHLSETAQDFIRQCCQFDKKLRPRTEGLLQHPFLSDE